MESGGGPKRYEIVQNQSGVSLIELMCAVFLVSGVVITISATFPRISRNIANNRQRWIANRLAASQITYLKGLPYETVDVSDVTLGTFATTCDCNNLDFSLLSSTSVPVAGTVFQVASCIHFVAPSATPGSFQSQCTASGDTGYKHILVKTSWKVGVTSTTVRQESLLTRY